MHFAKLFTIDADHQILVTKDWNDEDQKFEVFFTTDFAHIRLNLKLGFDNQIAADTAFNNVDLNQAYEVLDSLKNQVNNLHP